MGCIMTRHGYMTRFITTLISSALRSLQQVYIIDDFAKHQCNFEQLEEERIKVLINVERQKVAEKEAETSKKMAINEAEVNVTLSKILMAQTLLEKEGSRRHQEIENQMYLQRERCQADANFYGQQKRQKQTG
ncbi:hypothetical protein K1719_017123 [Acacia pycnantha]|nr:hypothetical protein K1719_017123 [Acacia pycnantha]